MIRQNFTGICEAGPVIGNKALFLYATGPMVSILDEDEKGTRMAKKAVMAARMAL